MKKTNLLSLVGVMSALLVSSAFAGCPGGCCGRRGTCARPAPRKAAPSGRNCCKKTRPVQRTCPAPAPKAAPKVVTQAPVARIVPTSAAKQAVAAPVKPTESVKPEIRVIQARFAALSALIKQMEAVTDKAVITTVQRNMVRQALAELHGLIKKLDTAEYNKQRILFNALRQRYEDNKGIVKPVVEADSERTSVAPVIEDIIEDLTLADSQNSVQQQTLVSSPSPRVSTESQQSTFSSVVIESQSKPVTKLTKPVIEELPSESTTCKTVVTYAPSYAEIVRYKEEIAMLKDIVQQTKEQLNQAMEMNEQLKDEAAQRDQFIGNIMDGSIDAQEFKSQLANQMLESMPETGEDDVSQVQPSPVQPVKQSAKPAPMKPTTAKASPRTEQSIAEQNKPAEKPVIVQQPAQSVPQASTSQKPAEQQPQVKQPAKPAPMKATTIKASPRTAKRIAERNKPAAK